MSTQQQDVYARITEEIIKKIEVGAGKFELPWHSSKDSTLMSPVNARTGNGYRGVNIISLWATGMVAGYDKGVWASYKQWEELGAQVRKGEKGTMIVFYKIIDIAGKAGNNADETQDGEEKPSNRLYARASYVFNVAQVDNYNQPPEPIFNPETKIEEAEKFFSSVGAVIEHGGNRACYIPSLDKIQMPKFIAFNNAESYYSVLAHEVTHWTGHSSRCDRDLKGRFGTESYAAEELVAELGAAFLCGLLGLSNEPREDHASYIANWLTLLKNDKKAIFTAASKAQEAVDWLEQKQSQNSLLSSNQKAA